MLTPKVLGLFLILVSFFTYLLSLYTDSKLTLFNSCMLFLFGCSACINMRSNPNTLKGKNILITGCDSGIGNALVSSLCDIGVNVFAGFLNVDGQPAKELQKKYSDGNLHTLQMDITSEQQVLEVYNTVKNLLKENNLYAVVNNAGLNFNGPVELTTMQQYENQMNINFLGTVRVTKTFLPLIRKSKGRFINISSVKGRFVWPTCAAYSAAKFAVEAFSDAFRRELGQYDVKMVIVEPGHFGGATNALKDAKRIAGDYEKMWQDASLECQQAYGRDFLDSMHKNTIGAASRSCPSLEPLLPGILEAIGAENPKDRYAIGGSKGLFDVYKIEMLLSMFLPATVMDMYTTAFYNNRILPKFATNSK